MNTNISIEEIDFEEGSGNPYADLGLPDAEEMLAKAQLAYEIQKAIESRKLKPQQAAERIGISQAELLDLLQGKFRSTTRALMIKYLTKLD
jgi:predicted XRE-type DNA-binding protein